MARHSGNYALTVGETFGGEGCTMKVYVYDEVDRFVTVARLSFSTKELTSLLNGVMMRRAELDQDPLF